MLFHEADSAVCEGAGNAPCLEAIISANGYSVAPLSSASHVGLDARSIGAR
jgi:hypothetical protein